MIKIRAYRKQKDSADISQLSVKRDWMDETWESHAYKCFPVSLTNQLGWGISFPEDISFIWDGISDSSSDHIKILSGLKYAHAGRGNATVSFNTGITFKTDENISLLTMPVPNYLRDGIQPFTTLMSTSFFNGELPCALRVTRPNTEITIKANTPIFSIIPINLEQIQDSEIIFEDPSLLPELSFDSKAYGEEVYKINMSGRWTNFYRDAVDHLGNILGKHQIKAVRLKVHENKSNI
jgi:hypothetical protein